MSKDDDDSDPWVFVPAKLAPLTQARKTNLTIYIIKGGFNEEFKVHSKR